MFFALLLLILNNVKLGHFTWKSTKSSILYSKLWYQSVDRSCKFTFKPETLCINFPRESSMSCLNEDCIFTCNLIRRERERKMKNQGFVTTNKTESKKNFYFCETLEKLYLLLKGNILPNHSELIWARVDNWICSCLSLSAKYLL